MLKSFKKIDAFLDRQLPILLILALMLLLRLPNLVEPYWYGDEGIYLTIGNAMSQGEKLYSQIIDHKTPIIYYLAMTPSQLWFRILNIVVMLITTSIFYVFCHQLFAKKWQSIIATFLFMILTTLPALEGNIPNGELFVMFFMFVGAALLFHTRFFQQFFSNTQKQLSILSVRKEYGLLVGAGIFFGLGVLTKVPGLFDLFAFLSIGWFSLIQALPFFKKKRSSKESSMPWLESRNAIFSTIAILVGVALPILYSIVYFVLRGSGKAYLDYGLLYNFRYAGSWKLPLTSPILIFAFSLVGKALVVAVVIGALTVLSRVVNKKFLFITSWFSLALFASLLSNRPYPHYFIQLVPPFVLLLTYIVAELVAAYKRTNTSTGFVKSLIKIGEVSLGSLLIVYFISLMVVLKAGFYPTISYYTRFFALVAGKMSPVDYRNSFDSLMRDNYAAAPIIAQSSGNHLFIWGTNPMLYAMSKKSPVGRFTVLFHIRDFKAEHETYLDFVKITPPYAAIMKGEVVPAEMKLYLESHYIPNSNFEHFVLWKRISG